MDESKYYHNTDEIDRLQWGQVIGHAQIVIYTTDAPSRSNTELKINGYINAFKQHMDEGHVTAVT